MEPNALLKVRLSYAEICTGLEHYQSEWNGFKPQVIKYLPQDQVLVNKTDRSFVELWRYLERASQAEERGQKWRATWWLVFVKATWRETAKLVEDLGERGLQIHERSSARTNTGTNS